MKKMIFLVPYSEKAGMEKQEISVDFETGSAFKSVNLQLSPRHLSRLASCLSGLAVIVFVSLSATGLWAQDINKRSGKTLIVYFSRVGISQSFDQVDAVSSASLPEGNTILAARMIHDRVGGALHQIITEKVYPAEYRATTDLAKIEQNRSERPRLANHVKDMEGYDTIFLGYPNWWGTLPMAVFTFLEEYDFSGKTIVPFCTHEGSRMGSSIRDLRRLAPEATILNGLATRGGNIKNAETDTVRWLKEIGY